MPARVPCGCAVAAGGMSVPCCAAPRPVSEPQRHRANSQACQAASGRGARASEVACLPAALPHGALLTAPSRTPPPRPSGAGCRRPVGSGCGAPAPGRTPEQPTPRSLRMLRVQSHQEVLPALRHSNTAGAANVGYGRREVRADDCFTAAVFCITLCCELGVLSCCMHSVCFCTGRCSDLSSCAL